MFIVNSRVVLSTLVVMLLASLGSCTESPSSSPVIVPNDTIEDDQTVPHHEYFPVQTTDQWIYRTSRLYDSTDFDTVEVVGKTAMEINGLSRDVYVVGPTDSPNFNLYFYEENGLYTLYERWRRDHVTLMYPEHLDFGVEWQRPSDDGSEPSIYRFVDTFDSLRIVDDVTGESSLFYDVIEIDLTLQGNSYPYKEYLASGIGLVYRIATNGSKTPNATYRLESRNGQKIHWEVQ